ncbi:coiled-coil domain-containing protein 34-like [Actinia tenebrosa]|uniref:Coiled-coil domain-containing protein 34-like n=1 Tax=Actinia tenebrosa TaxID=6105 RepID=A0A6P8HKY0_ACTTE|nr:coiled-coil domain-containing protein 34-like [Actinia tenebrosa]
MAYNAEEMPSFSDNYLDDSFASVGNSTRSLLSPLLNEKLRIRSSTPEKENQREIDDEEEESYETEKSRNMVLTSISLRNRSGKSLSSRSSHDPSRKTSQNTTCSSFASSINSTYISQEKEKQEQLSPWEDWLIKKSRQEREEMEKRKIEKWKEKRELMEKEKEEKEKRKKVEEKVERWSVEKQDKERETRQKKKSEMEQKRRIEIEKQQEIEKKSAVAYKKWLKKKRERELEAKKIKEIEEMKKKEKEVEKRMKCEHAFEEWLKKSKSQQKGESYSCGHGVLKSYYDWVSYPTPSYINPMPWVPPVSKKHREARQRRKELQPVSPPLLFRDYEKRRTKKNVVQMK